MKKLLIISIIIISLLTAGLLIAGETDKILLATIKTVTLITRELYAIGRSIDRTNYMINRTDSLVKQFENARESYRNVGKVKFLDSAPLWKMPEQLRQSTTGTVLDGLYQFENAVYDLEAPFNQIDKPATEDELRKMINELAGIIPALAELKRIYGEDKALFYIRKDEALKSLIITDYYYLVNTYKNLRAISKDLDSLHILNNQANTPIKALQVNTFVNENIARLSLITSSTDAKLLTNDIVRTTEMIYELRSRIEEVENGLRILR